MQIQECTINDVPMLARLNKQLIDDEKSNNSMSLSELENRMTEFLNTEYNAYYFIVDQQIVGYALIKMSIEPIYLRQFLIDRKYREQHYGKQAFQMLMQHLGLKRIDLEVLPWNEIGYSFWKSCGFKEMSIAMRYEE
ncbi:MAG: GNAT family N-acetyltransferase [Ruminococcus sp.]|nr:GNAT family N-acetyltransferase [Ruminococcus sp.]